MPLISEFSLIPFSIIQILIHLHREINCFNLKLNTKTKSLSIMAFDIEMIKKVYSELPSKIAAARKLLNRPLTLTEKILYAPLHKDQKPVNFHGGKSYVD